MSLACHFNLAVASTSSLPGYRVDQSLHATPMGDAKMYYPVGWVRTHSPGDATGIASPGGVKNRSLVVLVVLRSAH